uniref:Peptidase M3A/M3B catalytic domain-containing protein n=2 Tax=Emiliania huxleyi TaxID=2903 RepID=A0A7S3T968_EMIHU
MENWAYELRTLRGMAKHWKSGEPIDEATVHKLRSAKNYRAASMMLRQLKFAMGDLALHDTDFDPAKDDPFRCLEKVGERTSVLPSLPEDRFLCSFAHIFAGGYAAGYYSYKWAEVLSADGFAAFEEAGLEDESAIVALGRRYAETVMGLGGSLPAAAVFKLFRGRAPTADALLRHSDLA